MSHPTKTYEHDGAGSLRCLVCGKDGIGRAPWAQKGHEMGKQHKEAAKWTKCKN